jgi:hypothetical protein
MEPLAAAGPHYSFGPNAGRMDAAVGWGCWWTGPRSDPATALLLGRTGSGLMQQSVARDSELTCVKSELASGSVVVASVCASDALLMFCSAHVKPIQLSVHLNSMQEYVSERM